MTLIGSTTAIFVVQLSQTLSDQVDVEWATRDGTAKAGTDYVAASGVVTFLPGETEKQISVTVYGQDVITSDNLNFFIDLTPPTNAVLGTQLVECVIQLVDQNGATITTVVAAQGRRGLKGDPGMSAYDHAVLMGYTGTLAQWMAEIGDASAAATRAEAAATAADSDASRAEYSAQVAALASKVYMMPNDGVHPITGVPNGYYYSVRSASNDAYMDEYQNVNGVATATGKSYPSSAAVDAIASDVATLETAVIDPATSKAVASKVYDASGKTQQEINNSMQEVSNSIVYEVDTIADLKLITPRKNKQVVFVKSLNANFIYDSANAATANNVTIVDPTDVSVLGAWEMELQEAYYASWFCPASSIDNVNAPQTANIELGYRYATGKGRSFIIDNAYYVESTVHNASNSYPALSGADSLHYAIRVLSNSCLVFKKGVGKLKLVPNDATHSRVLCVFDIENYAIFDPECIGDKSAHLGTTGEQHYMIAFHASKNGYVRNPVTRDSWGDGLYFGYPEYISVFNVDVDYPTNLVIDNPVIKNSSRNGISLCGAENLTINNPLIDIVDRVAPIAGIDIEPEEDFAYSGKRMHLKNVKIHNLTSKNCLNYGVMSFIYDNRDIDVSFTGTTTISAKAPYYCSFPIWHNSNRGATLTEGQYTAKGAITFDKIVMDDFGSLYPVVAPISFHSELGRIKLDIGELTHTKETAGNVSFAFDNSTPVVASWSGGLNVDAITLNNVVVVELGQSGVTNNKALRDINLPIDEKHEAAFLNRGFQFGNAVNIGGHALVGGSLLNENQLINNIVLVPAANPADGNAIYSQVYVINKNRKLSYSLVAGLEPAAIGQGIRIANAGSFKVCATKEASITFEITDYPGIKIYGSFGNWSST